MHACVYVGEWPLVINIRTAFTAGNHSVSITAADSIGLSAQSIVPFTLLDTTRTNRELMLIDYHCIHSYNSYTIVKISKIYFHDFERADALWKCLLAISFTWWVIQLQECATCNHKKFSYCWQGASFFFFTLEAIALFLVLITHWELSRQWPLTFRLRLQSDIEIWMHCVYTIMASYPGLPTPMFSACNT